MQSVAQAGATSSQHCPCCPSPASPPGRGPAAPKVRAWTPVPCDLNYVILGKILRLSLPQDPALITELLGQRVEGCR